jgi:hypothetical protein
MKATFVSLLLKLVCFSLFGFAGGHANASALSDLLKKSDHVLLMRHALAPGVGDPAGYKLHDCKTQRNLDAKGREQAQRIGQWLSAQDVKETLVFSSAWCRCKETAENLGFGPPLLESSLNSFFDNMRQGPQSNARLQAFIASQLKTLQNLWAKTWGLVTWSWQKSTRKENFCRSKFMQALRLPCQYRFFE